MRLLSMKTLVALTLGTSILAGPAATLVSPNVNPGNVANLDPFLIDYPTNSIRYQQVYDAADFGPLRGQGGGYVSAVSFRLDEHSLLLYPATLSNVQIS